MKKYLSISLLVMGFSFSINNLSALPIPLSHPLTNFNWRLMTRVGIFIPAGTANVRVNLHKFQGERITIRLRDSECNVLLSYNVARRRSGFEAQVISLRELPDDSYLLEVSNGVEVVSRDIRLMTRSAVTIESSRYIYGQ